MDIEVCEVCIVNAFTLDGAGGNAAGVVVDAGGLDAQQMQDIAARMALSETAFVRPATDADFELRFFTPTREIDFCGHATVASFALLRQRGLLQKSALTQRTHAGRLGVRIADDGEVWMEQVQPEYGELLPAERVAAALGLPAEAIGNSGLPVQIISTGLADILVPVPDEVTLAGLRPNLAALARLNEETGTIGTHVFCLQPPGAMFSASCRNFAPLFGIDEESATGSSAGALAAYLCRHLSRGGGQFVFEQGRGMGRPSRLASEIESHAGTVSRVRVGGYATLAGTRSLRL